MSPKPVYKPTIQVLAEEIGEQHLDELVTLLKKADKSNVEAQIKLFQLALTEPERTATLFHHIVRIARYTVTVEHFLPIVFGICTGHASREAKDRGFNQAMVLLEESLQHIDTYNIPQGYHSDDSHDMHRLLSRIDWSVMAFLFADDDWHYNEYGAAKDV